MPAEPVERVSIGEILGGLAIGAAIPLCLGVIFYWPLLHYTLPVGGAIAGIAILLFGLPACLLLRALGWLNLYTVAAVGGMLCMLPMIYIVFDLTRRNAWSADTLNTTTWLLPVLAVLGAASAAVGWRIVVGARRNAG